MLPCFKVSNIKIETKRIKLFPSTLPAYQDKGQGHSGVVLKQAALKEEMNSLTFWSGIDRQRKNKNTARN